MRRVLALLLIFIPHFSHTLIASDELPTDIQPKSVHVGDPIHLTVTLQYSQGATFEIPSTSWKIGDLEVLAVNQGIPEKQPDGTLKRSISFDLAVYKTGKFTVPPIEIKQLTPISRIFRSAPGEIDISTVLTGQEKGIEDIKGPMAIPFEVPWLWLAVVLGLVAVLVLLWWFWKRRRSREEEGGRPSPVQILLSPEEEAMEALKRLEAAGLLRRNEFKEFCVRLTEILKHYVFRRHGVPVEERTTMEIMIDSAKSLPVNVYKILRDFLDRGDLVKFAKYQPTSEEIREMMKWAFRMIEISRPQAEAAVEASAAH